MKFFAMLRDSLRETLDVKLFYVLIALSLCTLLVVGSITYTPVPVEKQLRFITTLRNAAIRSQPGTERLKIETDIENFERTDQRAGPWLGDYAFDFVISVEPRVTGGIVTPEEIKEFKDLKKILRQTLTPDQLKQEYQATLFREVEVKKVEPNKDLPPNSEEIRFHVVTRGTHVKSREDWVHEPALLFGLVPIPLPFFSLGTMVWGIGTWIVGGLGGAFTLVVSIIITASFLPSMLTKGTVDLLLVKPIHRTSLFVYKFLGGLLFMFLNTVVIMAGLWLVLGLQTGVWLNALLLSIFVYTFQFAIIYSVSAVAAVLTRSTIVCILISFMTWGVLFLLGWGHWLFIENRREQASAEVKNHWAFVGFDLLYTLSPRYKELEWLTSKMVEKELMQIRPDSPPKSDDEEAQAEYEQQQKRAKETYEKQIKNIDKRFGSYNWTASVAVSTVFILVMLGLACLVFSFKDY